MKPEKIRIAIAESLGFVKICHHPTSGVWGWIKIELAKAMGLHSAYDSNGESYCQLPDYPNDLNAIHDVERNISTHKRECIIFKYIDNLKEVVGGGDNCFHQYCATAPQRCEAYLRTIGKWEE